VIGRRRKVSRYDILCGAGNIATCEDKKSTPFLITGTKESSSKNGLSLDGINMERMRLSDLCCGRYS